MRVETPAMKLNVELRKLEPGKDTLVFHGFANTMPCKVLVSEQEIWPVIKLLLNRHVFSMILKLPFKKATKKSAKTG